MDENFSSISVSTVNGICFNLGLPPHTIAEKQIGFSTTSQGWFWLSPPVTEIMGDHHKAGCSNGCRSNTGGTTTTTNSGFFEHFCHATSLHGWKFLASNDELTHKRPILKIGWIAVVIGSIGVAIFFLSHSFINFIGSTVMTTQDTTR